MNWKIIALMVIVLLIVFKVKVTLILLSIIVFGWLAHRFGVDVWLGKNIQLLRKAFDEEKKFKDFVKTHHKTKLRQYRLNNEL